MVRAKISLPGDAFGALAATLVALPSAIAFGLASFAALGPGFAEQAVLAGMVGTVIIALATATFSTTARLVSAPCAPAAAVLAVFVLEMTRRPGIDPAAIPLMVALVAIMAGILQVALGAAGGGRFIKYIPYPVVAGYLSGVGVLIVLSQLGKLFGITAGVSLGTGLFAPEHWQVNAVVTGCATILTMIFAPRITKKIPAAVIALATGIAVHYVFGALAADTAPVAALLIGPISASPSDLGNSLGALYSSFGRIGFSDLVALLVPAGTLAILLSVDTLKTCVVLDALVRGRHDSNRELIGQGLANCASALCGGMPGAGTMGATVVNVASGGKTRFSGFLVGVTSLAILFLLGPLVAGVPLAALAGLLVVVGVRMVDWKGFRLLGRGGAALDFIVVLAVIAAAVTLNLLAAAGVGVAMSILLFLRDQIRVPVVSRRMDGTSCFSKRRRLPAERNALEAAGRETAILELRGALFFGTTDQLFSELVGELPRLQRVILDMSRVQSIDYTGVNILKQIAVRLQDHGGTLAFASLPTGSRPLGEYLESTGLLEGLPNLRIFSGLDDALEWAEAEVIAAAGLKCGEETDLALGAFEIFSGFGDEALGRIRKCCVEHRLGDGAAVFRRGERGESLYLIRRGTVKIILPISQDCTHHLATFSRGDFFGDMAFLDGEIRSADAVAAGDVVLYEISRSSFNSVAIDDPKVAVSLFERFSLALALRLRQNNAGLAVLRTD